MTSNSDESTDSVDALEDRVAQLERRNRELELLAATDGLTGLLNKRAFQLRLAEEIQRATRYQHPLTLLLMDLDDFKRINDSQGHIAGDEYLKGVAQRMRAVFRISDVICRWGGEEFAAILPDTDSDGAVEAGDRVRSVVAEYGEGNFSATLSVEVASFSTECNTPEQLILDADAQLYRAKAGGRNQVSCNNGKPVQSDS